MFHRGIERDFIKFTKRTQYGAGSLSDQTGPFDIRNTHLKFWELLVPFSKVQ